MWTGTRTRSPAMRRLSRSLPAGSIPAPSFCSTALPKQTGKSWMSCWRNGRRWGTRSNPFRIFYRNNRNTGCRVFYGIVSMVAPRHRQYGKKPHSSQNRCWQYYNTKRPERQVFSMVVSMVSDWLPWLAPLSAL